MKKQSDKAYDLYPGIDNTKRTIYIRGRNDVMAEVRKSASDLLSSGDFQDMDANTQQVLANELLHIINTSK